MNGINENATGLNNNRQWTGIPDNDHPLEWCMDSAGDFLQGPLDMEFLRGKKIFLNLEIGQLALLVSVHELRAIYLDGGHILDVGSRPGQINPESSLIFLAADNPLDLRWTHGSPIDLPGPNKRHIIGNCSQIITGPARFFEQFLKDTPDLDAKTIADAIEKITRQTLSDFLEDHGSNGTGDQAGLQTTLMNLQAETLSEDLAGYGLSCTHLALYTAQPPVENCSFKQDAEETAGLSQQLVHN